MNTDMRLNLRNFEWVDGDMDYNVCKRAFSGRVTKERWKTLDRFCRAVSQRFRCGHEWDCCGCLCGRDLSFTYSRNQVELTLTESFNY